MKIITLFSVLCLPAAVFGKQFYLRGSLGFGLPLASQTIDGIGTPLNGSLNNTTSGNTNYVTYDLQRATYAPAIPLTLGGGYMFNDHIGVDLALTVGTSRKYTYSDRNVTLSNIAYDIDFTSQSRCVFVNPSLMMQTGSQDVQLYTRVGVALPVTTKITQHHIYTNLPGAGAVTTQDEVWEQKNQFNLGVTAAAGVSFATSEHVQLFGELSALAMSGYAKEANLVDVTLNGQGGYLPQVPVAQRKVTYSSNFSTTSGDYYHQPTFSLPYSAIYIQAGVRYGISNSSKKRTKGHNDVRNKRR